MPTADVERAASAWSHVRAGWLQPGAGLHKAEPHVFERLALWPVRDHPEPALPALLAIARGAAP